MKRLPKFSLWLVLPILLAAGTLHGISAQVPGDDQDEEYRRFSLSVHGGVTLENDDSGLKLFGSNFNRVTEHSYNIGGGVQYAFTPFWNVGAEYRYTTIDAAALFDTVVHSVTLKNYFNFNRLYRRFGISEYLNPFITLGIGRDFFTYQSEDITRPGNGIHFSTGFGFAGNITETIEVFAQYDLQMGSNSLDNIRSGFPADLLGMVSGGVRIYPGSRNKRRMSMAPPSVTLAEAEYDEFRQRRHRIPDIEEQTSERESEMAKLRTEFEDAFIIIFTRPLTRISHQEIWLWARRRSNCAVKRTDCTLIKQFDLQRSTRQNFTAKTDCKLNYIQNFSLNYWYSINCFLIV